MPRKIDDLEKHAAKFWPTVLTQREQKASIIPRLIESQEKFIGLLYVADRSPTSWKDALETTKGMPANLFLKHLIVLSDVSGESLNRYRTDIRKFFPNGTMTFRWRDVEHNHKFCSLEKYRTWTNGTLKVGGAGLTQSAGRNTTFRRKPYNLK